MLTKTERIEGRRMTEAATKGSYAAIKREELLLHYDTIDKLVRFVKRIPDDWEHGGVDMQEETMHDAKARSVLGYKPTVNPLDYLREYDLKAL